MGLFTPKLKKAATPSAKNASKSSAASKPMPGGIADRGEFKRLKPPQRPSRIL